MPSAKLKTPLEVNHYYHIYNRGNNRETLFYTEDNYEYFLRRYHYFLNDYVITYAYCLIPNHFHFLIRVVSDNVSHQLQKFFQSYAISINIQENRTGSLFQKTFRRILIQDNVYLKWLVFYIHHNPEKHGVCKNYKHYKYSSYLCFLSGFNNVIKYDEVCDWFGGRKAFIEFHKYHYEKIN